MTNAPERHGQTEVDKLRGWLGTLAPWGVVQLVRQRISNEAYIALMVPRDEQHWLHGLEEGERHYHAEFKRWLRHYENDGISGMIEVVYLIVKLPAGSREWNVERFIVDSDDQRRRSTATWLQAMEEAHGADWQSHSYGLSAGTFCGGTTQLVVRSPLWGLACEQPGADAVALANLLAIRQTGSQVLQWATARGLSEDSAWQILATLSQLGAIETTLS